MNANKHFIYKKSTMFITNKQTKRHIKKPSLNSYWIFYNLLTQVKEPRKKYYCPFEMAILIRIFI